MPWTAVVLLFYEFTFASRVYIWVGVRVTFRETVYGSTCATSNA